MLANMAGDFASATAAAFLVAPFITIVDKSIVKNANGSQKLGDALRQGAYEFLASPHRFLSRREFLIVWSLYTATYSAANWIDTTCNFFGESHDMMSTCM